MVQPIEGLVVGNALAKAREVARRTDDGLVIGADTVVVCEGELFGKPVDMEDAMRILRRLAGRTHQVYSGVVVVRAGDGLEMSAHARTDVTFRSLSESEIGKYLEMIDPLDKAGAYAIQGIGTFLVKRINGSYTNVVGLPVCEVLEYLIKNGIVELSGDSNQTEKERTQI